MTHFYTFIENILLFTHFCTRDNTFLVDDQISDGKAALLHTFAMAPLERLPRRLLAWGGWRNIVTDRIDGRGRWCRWQCLTSRQRRFPSGNWVTIGSTGRGGDGLTAVTSGLLTARVNSDDVTVAALSSMA